MFPGNLTRAAAQRGADPVTVADVIRVVDRLYPPDRAEAWDAVGLAVGSRSAPVSKISYTVEVTEQVVEEAVSLGADLIIAHHPLFLRGVHGLDLDHPKGRVAGLLVRHGIALYVAHTNSDIPPGGVVDALADALGLIGTRPLRPRPGRPLDKVVTFVPEDYADSVIDAMAAAGAGAIGSYDRCAFTHPGTGTFRPLPGAKPFVGRPGRIERVSETRVEMVLAREQRSEVVAALLAAHPYETVAYDLIELAPTPSADTGLGRVGRLAADLTLGDFARRIAEVLPRTAAGVRVAGDLDQPVRSVAVQAGAGDDLLEAARAVAADVYVTSDLRHHPASEARAWAAAPALVDVAHWAAEWTWLPVAQRLVAALLDAAGIEVPSHVSTLCTDPWNALF